MTLERKIRKKKKRMTLKMGTRRWRTEYNKQFIRNWMKLLLLSCFGIELFIRVLTEYESKPIQSMIEVSHSQLRSETIQQQKKTQDKLELTIKCLIPWEYQLCSITELPIE